MIMFGELLRYDSARGLYDTCRFGVDLSTGATDPARVYKQSMLNRMD